MPSCLSGHPEIRLNKGATDQMHNYRVASPSLFKINTWLYQLSEDWLNSQPKQWLLIQLYKGGDDLLWGGSWNNPSESQKAASGQNANLGEDCTPAYVCVWGLTELDLMEIARIEQRRARGSLEWRVEPETSGVHRTSEVPAEAHGLPAIPEMGPPSFIWPWNEGRL